MGRALRLLGAWAAAPLSAQTASCQLLRAVRGHLFPLPCSGSTNATLAAGTAMLEAFTPQVLAAYGLLHTGTTPLFHQSSFREAW